MTTTCTVCELHAESTFKVEGHGLPRGGRAARAAVQAPARPRGLLGRPDGAAAPREVRRGEALDRRRSPRPSPTPGMRAWLEHEEPIAAGDARRGARAARCSSAVGRARSAPDCSPSGRRSPSLRAAAAVRASSIARGRAADGRKAWHALRARVARHQRADARRRRRRDRARRVVRGGRRRLPVRRRAGARSADARARADGGPRADGSDAAEALVRDGGGERRSPSTRSAPGAVIVVKPGEKIPLDGEVVAGRSAVNQAPVTGESLPVDKAAGRRGVRRHHQRPRRARRARHAAPPRHDAGAHHPPRRAGAGAARAGADLRRALRARLHAGGHSCWRRRSPSCRRSSFGGAWDDVDLSRARAARRLVSVRARHLDAGVDRRGAGRRGAEGRAHQGRRAPRAGGTRPVRRVRQDRHADARHAGGGRRHRAERRRRQRPSSRWPPRSSSGPSIRLPSAIVALRRRPRAIRVPRRQRRDGAGRSRRRGTRRAARGCCSATIGCSRSGSSARRRSTSGSTTSARAAGRRCSSRATAQPSGSSPSPIGRARPAATRVDLLRRQGIESIVMLTGDSDGTAQAIAAELGVDEFRAELLPEDKVAAVARAAPPVRIGGDGRRRRERCAGAGVGRRRDRDGRRRQRRRARDAPTSR